MWETAPINRSRLAVLTVDRSGTVIKFKTGSFFSESLLVDNPIGINLADLLSPKDARHFFDTLTTVLQFNVSFSVSYYIQLNKSKKKIDAVFVPDLIKNTVDIFQYQNFYNQDK